MKEIGIGLLGFGTVGAGVVEALQRHGDLIAKRTGIQLVLKKIADLDIETDRGVEVPRPLLTTRAQAVIEDPDIQVVVELIGGTTVARDLVLMALEQGKPVVTANKALLAEHGMTIFQTAHTHNTDLFYEASVGGGIPIIRSLREGLIGNHIESIYGILNGTCNYILTRMEEENLPFEEVLREAQAAGFAEAEPSLDIDGIDTAHKTVILAALAYGFPITLSQVHVEGLRGLDPVDLAYAKELGYRIKLLAIIKNVEGDVEARVHPTLIPLDHMLASVRGVFNAVLVTGDVVGETLYVGRGAGREATASAVVSDIADVARNLVFRSATRVPAFVEYGHYGEILPLSDIRCRYYLRLSLLDQPGVLGRVTNILGEHHISIASVIQKETSEDRFVSVVIVTHHATEKDMSSAITDLDALDQVGGPAVRLRIEDFG
jgi:homoserine dehydrogenase